ncbi:DUF305 domain-containing protein [Rubrobacter tropicus]|uniref:DUF305 domain-containing protein n=1 Tax=Rubrobacter tropicus TaxID=2653851 RepID=A0A6G8QBR8_9ACTN|nr:DUF305 domain-containing protein [Rubrobacter tropicus]QIN83883.1 DUF305 domain-containing protein [Rubrobacter tropicus]
MPSKRSQNTGPLLFALAAAVVLLVALSLWLYLSGQQPEDGSAEAGFARDMSVHHAQAVEMAEIVRDKTASEEVRLMAADMALAQQGQIGRMQGWLDAWGLSPTGTQPAMSWMGHPTEGRMPGMASPEEIERLQNASPEEADKLFFRLMIPHHQAAVPMAEAAMERTDRPEVDNLAGAIVAAQEGEIEIMKDMLRERGANAPLGSHDDGHSH